MKIMRWTWIAAGAGVGYVLGTRAGRERYEQMSRWSRKTAQDFGLAPAVGQVMDSAAATVGEARDAAASKSHQVFDNGANAISERLEAAGDSISTTGTENSGVGASQH